MTPTADPREIIAAVYDGKLKGAVPMGETAAAGRLAKLGATAAEVGHVMSRVEEDTFWNPRVQSVAQLEGYWTRLRKQFIEPSAGHRPYAGVQEPARLPPRDIATWGQDHRFSSEAAKQDFLARAARIRGQIEAAQRAGIRGSQLFRHMVGGVQAEALLDEAIGQAREQTHWSEPGEPAAIGQIVRLDEREARQSEPEPEPAVDEFDELDELEAVSF
jgi:hypothetical protein